jgi:poly-gamma-glutamate synthesis protein (capsule biosynthesis protein)
MRKGLLLGTILLVSMAARARSLDGESEPKSVRQAPAAAEPAGLAALPPADPPAARLQLGAVGDVLFGRYLETAEGTQYRAVTSTAEPFAAVDPLLERIDVLFGNLETPVMEPPAELRAYANRTFRADPGKAGVLARAGFDVVSLANNHVLNLGWPGATRSRFHLQGAGVATVGAGETLADALQPTVVERHGLRLAFVAVTLHNNDRAAAGPGGAVAYVHESQWRDLVLPAVRAARALPAVDFVIASVHWGREFAPHPQPEQRELGHLLVDAGADVVLGHHPHVIQDIERYGRAVIAYSLGNFLFDQPPPTRRQTLLLQVALQRLGGQRQVGEVVLHPLIIDHEQHVPRPPSGNEDRPWRRRLAALAPGCTLAAAPLELTASALPHRGAAPPPGFRGPRLP